MGHEALNRRELEGWVGKEDQSPQKPIKGGNSISSETIAFSPLNMALIFFYWGIVDHGRGKDEMHIYSRGVLVFFHL